MILQRVEQPDWLSNAYLVVDEPGGNGVLVDSNGVTDPLPSGSSARAPTITHVLLTHHHWDHVVEMEKLAERFGVPVLAHREDRRVARRQRSTETIDRRRRRSSRATCGSRRSTRPATAPTTSP